MKNYFLSGCLIISTFLSAIGQDAPLKPFDADEAWKQSIYKLAPEKPVAEVSKKHKILVFSLFTGFDHWVIPHATAVVQILAEKTGAFEVVLSNDIDMFENDKLKAFDAVVLNNNCSKSDRRDLFYDALVANTGLSDEERKTKAAQLEENLLKFVKKGGGLAVLHGGIVMQNNSPAFSQMLGGSFDYHPPQQEIELKVVDKTHPLTKAFPNGNFIHIDEPYFFKNAYKEKHFKPLLYMETSKINDLKHEPEDSISYVSWIKRYGKGRVFYTSPSHNAQSYENASMLQFYLNGLQYVLGDLKCDDSSIK